MRALVFMNILLIGLVILLGALFIEANRAENVAIAQDDARPPSAARANGVIAVVGRLFPDADVLYLVDTNNETILTYAYGRPSGSSGRIYERGSFYLLSGRPYKWDTLAASKVAFGRQEGPEVKDLKKIYLEKSKEDKD